MISILGRTLASIFTICLVILALDIFNIPFLSGPEKAVAFVIHLIPAFLAAICLAVSWKRATLGGWLFLALAVGFTLFFHTYQELSAFLAVSLPPAVIGGLFVWEGIKQKK